MAVIYLNCGDGLKAYFIHDLDRPERQTYYSPSECLWIIPGTFTD